MKYEWDQMRLELGIIMIQLLLAFLFFFVSSLCLHFGFQLIHSMHYDY